MEWSNGGLYIHYCWLSFLCLQLFYLLRYRYITFRSRFRKYLFLTFESPKAVTTVDTSNMYQIMLLLILVMQACVVCVDACAFFASEHVF